MTFPFPTFTTATRKTLTLTDTANDGTTSSSHNYGTLSIGPEFSGRIIAIALTGSTGTGGRGFSACVCGGVTGTRVLNETSGGGGNQCLAVFVFEGVTGTTATVTATSTSNIGAGEVGVFALGGVSSATPVSTGANATSGTTLSVPLTLTGPAAILAFIRTGASSASITFTGGPAYVGEINSTKFAVANNAPASTTAVGATIPSGFQTKLAAAAWQ